MRLFCMTMPRQLCTDLRRVDVFAYIKPVARSLIGMVRRLRVHGFLRYADALH